MYNNSFRARASTQNEVLLVCVLICRLVNQIDYLDYKRNIEEKTPISFTVQVH